MRRKRLADLKPKDPVRHRVRDLDAAYERIVGNLKALRSAGGTRANGDLQGDAPQAARA